MTFTLHYFGFTVISAVQHPPMTFGLALGAFIAWRVAKAFRASLSGARRFN